MLSNRIVPFHEGFDSSVDLIVIEPSHFPNLARERLQGGIKCPKSMLVDHDCNSLLLWATCQSR